MALCQHSEAMLYEYNPGLTWPFYQHSEAILYENNPGLALPFVTSRRQYFMRIILAEHCLLSALGRECVAYNALCQHLAAILYEIDPGSHCLLSALEGNLCCERLHFDQNQVVNVCRILFNSF